MFRTWLYVVIKMVVPEMLVGQFMQLSEQNFRGCHVAMEKDMLSTGVISEIQGFWQFENHGLGLMFHGYYSIQLQM